MVGLSVVLETAKSLRDSGGVTSPKTPQVLNKTGLMITAAAAAERSSGSRQKSCVPDTGFLEHCFLCKRKLLSGKDIYMYKGDRAFCSVECRSRQIIMDEEENCYLVAIKTTTPSASPSSSSSSSSSSPAPATSGGYSRHRRGPRNRDGGFVH